MVASTLAVGDIAIIGIKTGQAFSAPATADEIYFVLLAPIGSGTQIHFTDRTWTPTAGSTALNAGSFSNSGADGTYTYTAGADLPAGTVIKITAAQLSGAGIDLDNLGEGAIYAYQGAVNAPTKFLFALEVGDENNTFNASLVNTGLTAGYSAVSIGHESAGYAGPTTHAESFLWNGHASTLMHSIADHTNWHGDSADQGGLNNAEDPEIQDGPWLKHADIELWGTIGAGGLGSTNGDNTHSSGADDYNHTRQYEGVVNGQQVFWFASDMQFDTAEGKFFVVDSDIGGGNNRILQGNISDLLSNPEGVPTLTQLFSDAGTTIASRMDNLDIDLVNNIIYFTRGSQVLKIGYNTANQAGTILFDANAQGAVTASAGNPAGSTNNFFNDMVINFSTGKIYLSSTRVGAAAGGDILQKNFIYELSGLTTSSGANAFTMNGTTNTGTARLLPFAENDQAYNPSGATYNPWSSTQDPYAWPQERGTLDGLAIDQVNNILYIGTGETLQDHDGSSATGAIYAGGGIYSYALAPANAAQGGANAVVVLHQQTVQFGGALPGLIGDIEFDAVGGHIYIVDYAGASNSTTDNHIYRINANGTGLVQWSQTIGQEGDATTMVGITLNRAPTLTGSAAGGLAVTEASSAPNSGETSRVTLFTGISMSDFETTIADEITGAVVRIGEGFTYEAASTAGGHTGTIDYLRINGTTTGTIAGSGIQYTYNQTTGAMVLTGAATAAEYKAAIELVQFSTSGDNVTNDGNAVTRKVYVSVSDGLTMSDEIVATVNVTGINDAPVNTPGAAMNFTEDTTGTVGQASPSVIAPVNAITGISIADADADATSETFTVTLSVTQGTLTIRTDVTGGLTAGQVANNGTASITLTGTQNAINATLAATTLPAQGSLPNGLVYTPAANYNGADTLTIVTNDNGNNGNDPDTVGDNGTSEADTDTKTLNIADVNDAPTVSDATQDSPAILEDVPFTDANAPTVATLFGASFSDALDVQFNAATNPTGSAGDTLAGIAIVGATGNANGQWQYWDGDSWENIGTGTQAAARTISAGTQIRFNPALNYNGAAPTLTVHLIETGAPAITNNGVVNLSPAGTATGGTTFYSAGTVVLSQAITAVNDAPVNTVGGGITLNEDAAAVAVTGISIADVDAGSSPMTVTLNVEHGLLTIRTDVAGGITGAHVSATAGTTITVTATAAQINATLAAANGLTYLADAHYNGADRVRVTTSDNGASGQDPVPGTGTGTDEQDVDDKAITINAVNDEPAGADKSITMLEDGRYTFTAADFGFIDAIDNHGLHEVVITTLPATGTLYLLSFMPMPPMGMQTIKTAVVAGQAIPVGEITGGRFVYEPAQNANGPFYSSFTFQVRDNGGTANGGQNTDQTANTIEFDVTAVNDAPTITNLGTNNAVWTEGSGPVRLDNGVDAVVGDIDSPDFDGGTLTVSYTNGLPEDQYTIDTSGVVSVTIDPNDSTIGTVSVNGVQIATYTFTSSGYSFALDADATPAAVQALVRAIGYSNNAGDNPTGGVRNVTWMLNDGDGNANFGNPILFVNSTVTVNAVNDAPTGQDNTVVTSEDDAYTFTWADFGFSDPAEGDAGIGVRIDELPTAGALQLDGVAVTDDQVISKSDIDSGKLKFVPAANQSGTSYDSFKFSVRDDGGTANGGQEFDTSAKVMKIDVTPDNLSPTFDLSNLGPGSTLAYTENGAAGALAPSAQLADSDSANFDTGTLSVSFQSGGTATDQLSIIPNAAITVASGEVSYNGTVFATYNGGVNGASLDFLFDADATPEAVQALVRAIGYSSTSDAPGAGPKVVNFALTDGDGGTAQANATVNITETNDAPAIDLNGGGNGIDATLAYTEGDGALVVTSLATAGDIDSANLDGGALTITGAIEAGDVVTLQGAAFVYDPNDNSLSVNGVKIGTLFAVTGGLGINLNANATPALVQQVLRGIHFESTGDDPVAGDRTLSYTLSDGDGGTSTLAVATVTVTAVNDLTTVNDDSASTDEATDKVIDVLDNDVALDGPTKAVTHINGNAVTVGSPVAVTGGGTVTLQANGTLVFKPNGDFDHLTEASSGGTNLQKQVTFTYTEADGKVGTVTVTVTGIRGPNDDIVGGSGDNYFYVDDMSDEVIEAANAGTDTVETGLGSATDYTQLYTLPANVENFIGTNAGGQGVFDNALNNSFTMAAGNDLVVLTGGGDDKVNGGEGNDFVYVGAAWSSGDEITGGLGYDTVGFLGGGNILFGAASLSGVEQLSFYGSSVSNGAAIFNVTMRDENLGANQTLLVTAFNLIAGESLTFNGAAELDGAFTVLGGAGGDAVTGGAGKDFIDGNAGNDILDGGGGSDRLIGGTGADQLTGGAGKDFFLYESVADSNTTTGVDLITDFQGTAAGERIDLTAIDAVEGVGGNQAFVFIGVGTAFTAAGQLRVVQTGNNWFVEGDTNGDGTADLTIQIGGGGNIPWASSDFFL